MKCPNCFFPMKYFYYHAPYLIEYYECPMCHIKYNKTSCFWNIPDRYERITYKQQQTIDFINNILKLNLQPILKSEATFMIKKYIKKAAKIAKNMHDSALEDIMYDDVFSPFGGFYNEFCNG